MLKAIVCLLCLILVLTVVLFGGCDDRRHPWHGLQPRVQSCGRRRHPDGPAHVIGELHAE